MSLKLEATIVPDFRADKQFSGDKELALFSFATTVLYLIVNFMSSVLCCS